MKPAGLAAIAHESLAKARKFLDTAPRCTKCGGQIVASGRTTHFACDPTSLVGRPCICGPGCSDNAVGDGATPCHPQCPICTTRAGAPLK